MPKLINSLEILFKKLEECKTKNPQYDPEFLKKTYESGILSVHQPKNKMPSSSQNFSSNKNDFKKNEEQLNEFLAKIVKEYYNKNYDNKKNDFSVYKEIIPKEITKIIPNGTVERWKF